MIESIGTPEKELTYQQTYIEFVMEHYSQDKNILIDSSGLPNSIHFPMTHVNIHNGKVSNKVRLIFVVQKSTGLPLYYRAVPGNIVDVSTLSRILLHLDSLGIDIDSCIMDAGYNSGERKSAGAADHGTIESAPKKRGRPKKQPTEPAVPKKRGRPRKNQEPELTAVPKKRGRPRKNDSAMQ